MSGNRFIPSYCRSEKDGLFSSVQTDDYGEILNAGHIKYWDSSGAVVEIQNNLFKSVTDLPLEVDQSISSRIIDDFLKTSSKVTGEVGYDVSTGYCFIEDRSSSDCLYIFYGNIYFNKDTGSLIFNPIQARKERI